MALPDLILDMNRVFTEGDPAPEELSLLQKIDYFQLLGERP